MDFETYSHYLQSKIIQKKKEKKVYSSSPIFDAEQRMKKGHRKSSKLKYHTLIDVLNLKLSLGKNGCI